MEKDKISNLKRGKVKIINYREGEFGISVTKYKAPVSFDVIPIIIEKIEKGAIEKYSLCSGAELQCNCGDNNSIYTVLPTKKVSINNKPLAVISDTKPMINIKPFGLCKSMANPTVAAATAANRGKLQKMPCVPNIVETWSEGIKHFLAKEQTPCNLSKVKCLYSGLIRVVDSGQNILGSSSSSSSTNNEKDKNEETNKEEKEIKGTVYLKSKNFSKT